MGSDANISTLGLSVIKERLLSMPHLEESNAASILYQHTVLCQTCMPYRNPGDGIRRIERCNGTVRLELDAGRLLDPARNEFVDVGLPFGPKARIILFHMNAVALRTQSPCIELEDSLTGFVHRTLQLNTGARTIRAVKEQLNRLAAANFRLGLIHDGCALTIKTSVVDCLELWTPRDPSQKILWPTTIQFSRQYFESLLEHAVPLNEDAVSRLSHSALCLDLYTWLAQRLHRVNPIKDAFVPWVSLKEQFGFEYARMNKFREKFLIALKEVWLVYPAAKFELDRRGMHLKKSPPPVPPKVVVSTTGG